MSALRSSLFLACCSAFATASAQPSDTTPDGVAWQFEASAQAIHENAPFWGLAQQFAPATRYDRRFNWVEAQAKPGLRLQRTMGDDQVYGGLSAVASYTASEDLFLQGDQGRIQLEDAFAGWRRPASPGRPGIDLSAGSQPYRLAHGFLLASGAGNGFERGAAVMAPRRAWAMTAIARLNTESWTAEGFYLDPRELQSSNSRTRMAGLNMVWTPEAGHSLGLAHFRVLESSAPYPKAPLTILEGGRDGLSTTDLHWKYEPASGPLAGFSTIGEIAWQRNARIAMRAKGAGVEAAYRMPQLPGSPRFSYSWRYFSGDNPATPDRLERFDGLFYEGSPQTWSSGGNGSFAFYNANLVVHRFRVDLVLSPRDFLNISYWNVRAARTDSPLQYGQAGRLALGPGGLGLVSGVPDKGLSHEWYVEHTRVLSPQWFLTLGMAYAAPRSGIKALLPQGSRDWIGVLANITYRH